MHKPELGETWTSVDFKNFYGKVVYVGKHEFVLELNSVFNYSLSIYGFDEIGSRIKRTETSDENENG